MTENLRVYNNHKDKVSTVTVFDCGDTLTESAVFYDGKYSTVYFEVYKVQE